MMHEGPPIEMLLRRLTECPSDFLDVGASHSAVNKTSERDQWDQLKQLHAILCDHFRAMRCDFEASALLNRFQARTASHRGLASVMVWLLHDPWFLSRLDLMEPMCDLVCDAHLERLSTLVPAESFVHDPDRREELARFCLSELGYRPSGETVEQAADRLATLDTIERDHVLTAMIASEKRTREIREAMAQAKAMESASRYGE
jgi:hypothetical protein